MKKWIITYIVGFIAMAAIILFSFRYTGKTMTNESAITSVLVSLTWPASLVMILIFFTSLFFQWMTS